MSKKLDKKAKEKDQNKTNKEKNSLLNETMLGRSLLNRSGLVADRQTPQAREHSKTVLSHTRQQPGADGGSRHSVLSMLFTRNARKPIAAGSSSKWPSKRTNRLLLGIVSSIIVLGVGVGGIVAINPETLEGMKGYFGDSFQAEDDDSADSMQVPPASIPASAVNASRRDAGSEGKTIFDSIPVKEKVSAPTAGKSKVKVAKAKSQDRNKAKGKPKKSKSQGKKKAKANAKKK